MQNMKVSLPCDLIRQFTKIAVLNCNVHTFGSWNFRRSKRRLYLARNRSIVF